MNSEDFYRQLMEDPSGPFGIEPQSEPQFPNAYIPDAHYGSISPRVMMPSDYLRAGLKTVLPDTTAQRLSGAAVPFDFAAEAGQQSAENLNEAVHAPNVGNVAMAGLDASGLMPQAALAKAAAPFAKAMFVGPTFMRRLEKAGRVLPGAKGSEDALYEAQKAWERGVDPRQVWEQHGWAPGDAFGKRIDGGHQSPMAWHPMPDIDLANYNNGRTTAPIGKAFTGVEDAAIGAPEFLNKNVTTTIDPNMPERAVKGYIETARNTIGDMGIYGRTPEEARMIGVHEFGHGMHAIDDFYNPNAVFDDDALMRLTHGTKAEHMAKTAKTQASSDAERFYQERRMHPTGSEPAKMGRAKEVEASTKADRMRELQGGIPKYAAYINSPHERRARANALNYSHGRDASMTSAYPGDINTFSDEAMWPFRPSPEAREIGITWEDYAQPFVDENAVRRFSGALR